jgi:hypothetical protein
VRSTAFSSAMFTLIVAADLFSGPACSAAPATDQPCSDSLMQSLHETERQIDSLRPDKSGQARVFAADGSEFTAGQAMWMKGQLQRAEQSCAVKDSSGATDRLGEVKKLLQAHLSK